ncbi:MAG: SpoIVB peptidase S55 domain-containing protein [Eubacterium sp.]
MRKAIRIFDIVFALCCVVVFGFVTIGEYALPDKIITYENEENDLSSIFSYSDNLKTQSVDYQSAYPTQETIKLLGVVPVKSVTVTNKESQQVYVSGEAFGIKLYTDGVIVVGTQSVDLDGKKVNPAQEAGIKTGDIIIAINGTNVYSSDDVTSILNDNNGKPYTLKIKRDDRYKTFTLTPAYSNREGCYKAGMWVRDSTAGIGTVTFYNKQNGTFAALGHQINDVDTNELMPLLEGEAVSASVTNIQKAESGSTGSLVCNFEDYTIGKLTENTSCGVYGSYSAISDSAKLYTVASAQNVQKGNAQILSTIDSGEPRYYDIEITHISYTSNGEKDIVFKITDDDLLEKTGGIVQGM